MNFDRLYKTIAAVESGPQVDIQSHVKLTDSVIKVVATVNGVANESDFDAAINVMTNGSGRVIPGSFNMRGRIVVATVASNSKSQPIDASFTMLTASTAMDVGGNIWDVVDIDGHKRVVLESSDDLAAILAARQASRKHFANPVEGAGLATASFNNGEIVRYVDTATKTATWGFAFNTVDGVQVATANLNVVTIDPQAIVASVPRTKLDETARKAIDPILATAKLDSAKMSAILNYLKKAYPVGGMASELFAKYAKLASMAQ